MPIVLDDATATLLVRALARLPPASGQIIIGMLQEQSAMITEQGKLLTALQQKVDQMSGSQVTQQDFDTEIAGLRDDVAKQTTVANGVLVFVKGLSDKLAEALARPDPNQALAAVRQIHSDLNANTQELVTATTDSTPAATEPPAPVQPTTTVDTSGSGDASGTVAQA